MRARTIASSEEPEEAEGIEEGGPERRVQREWACERLASCIVSLSSGWISVEKCQEHDEASQGRRDDKERGTLLLKSTRK